MTLVGVLIVPGIIAQPSTLWLNVNFVAQRWPTCLQETAKQIGNDKNTKEGLILGGQAKVRQAIEVQAIATRGQK